VKIAFDSQDQRDALRDQLTRAYITLVTNVKHFRTHGVSVATIRRALREMARHSARAIADPEKRRDFLAVCRDTIDSLIRETEEEA
jgi:hypothetical protein